MPPVKSALSQMNLATALLLFLIVASLIYLFLRGILFIRPWSAGVVALLSGVVVMNIAMPPTEVSNESSNWLVTIYVLLELLALLLLWVYILERAWMDRLPDCCPSDVP